MISCSDYDYFEIVCMFHYPITLSLQNGEELTGVAVDLCRDEQKNECIQLNVDGTLRYQQLTQIAKLTINVRNPHFGEKQFS
ncbi:transcriptional antiterminator [Pseudoalteromonas rubra]|uniref:Transcriptional antiterminator n=1 Tax=Pseudoalteromonas rubra TaxID=43658 RepID=A0A5S3WS74_9GAMM|nr:Rho-binding antiterminator [Pseudoalteromonas rubra]TMP30224.1 transcriptional antiterminator [Pseudoalteromonas rubra]TMP31907.1 transcriptional antiterminator [Pseudoalteromonas rubra]